MRKKIEKLLLVERVTIENWEISTLFNSKVN